MLDYDVPSDDEDYDPTQRRNDIESIGAPTPRPDGAVSSPAPFGDDGESQRGEEEDDEESDEAGSGYDSDLAKEIEKDLNMANKGAGGTDESGTEDDEDGDGLFGSDDDDDDEEEAVDAETLEARKRLKLLAEEMSDLDRAIAAKEVELSKAPNPIFKVRFALLLRRDQALMSISVRRNALRKSSKSLRQSATSRRISTPRSPASSTRSARTLPLPLHRPLRTRLR